MVLAVGVGGGEYLAISALRVSRMVQIRTLNDQEIAEWTLKRRKGKRVPNVQEGFQCS